MVDFTSALYLGLSHSSCSLEPWEQLSTGRPAALCEPPGHVGVAERIASLTGCERATLSASTLHVFWDLFGMIGKGASIYVDAGAYPIARWGCERAAARGIHVRSFAHYRTRSLVGVLAGSGVHRRPVVVADGFCPGCGRVAPVQSMLAAIEPRNGLLILDDTQAIGLLGRGSTAQRPYGHGGGGSLQAQNIRCSRVLLVSSLAKAFGAGVAVLAGSRELIEEFEQRSETRVHTSPPSAAVVRAAERALAINEEMGDRLRDRLCQLVARFRAQPGLPTGRISGNLFPVQTPALSKRVDVEAIHRRLLRRGVRPVLHHARNGSGARLSFIITARHTPGDIVRAARALRSAMSYS